MIAPRSSRPAQRADPTSSAQLVHRETSETVRRGCHREQAEGRGEDRPPAHQSDGEVMNLTLAEERHRSHDHSRTRGKLDRRVRTRAADSHRLVKRELMPSSTDLAFRFRTGALRGRHAEPVRRHFAHGLPVRPCHAPGRQLRLRPNAGVQVRTHLAALSC